MRKAYEQGRLLDPQDLTDDSLFRLVREDENVRVLITHEIEDRFYIRAKPTREELERGLVTRPNREQPKEAAAGDQNKRTENEEDVYWSTHEGAEERYYHSPTGFRNLRSPRNPLRRGPMLSRQPTLPRSRISRISSQPAPAEPGAQQLASATGDGRCAARRGLPRVFAPGCGADAADGSWGTAPASRGEQCCNASRQDGEGQDYGRGVGLCPGIRQCSGVRAGLTHVRELCL